MWLNINQVKKWKLWDLAIIKQTRGILHAW
jgi:hypothetical protein